MAEDDTLPPGVEPQLDPAIRHALANERLTVAVRDMAHRIDVQNTVINEYAALGASAEKLKQRTQSALTRVLEHRIGGIIIAATVGLTLLRLVGVDVDVNQLVDSLAHWRTGQPHKIECTDSPAPMPLDLP